MMLSPAGPTPAIPPLGCQLHDWSLTTREDVRVVPNWTRRGLVVDLDDTLYQREEYVQSGLLAVARHVEERFGLSALDAFATLTDARRGGHEGQELQRLCRVHGLSPRLVRELIDVFRAHPPVLRLARRTVATLTRLRAEGWQIVVLTNGLPAVQRAKVAALKLVPLVDAIVYAEEHAEGGKPAPAAFRAALQRLALPARRCVAVGDDPRADIAGARRAGLRTVRLAVPGRVVAPEDEADVVIDTFEALPAVVAHLLDMVTPDAA